MRTRPIALAALAALALAPRARAQQCRSVPECLARAGLGGHPDPLFALVTAAVAAPVLLTGAVVTAGGEVRAQAERPLPTGVIAIPSPPAEPGQKPKKPRLELTLIPTPDPPPPPVPPTRQELRNRESRQRAVQVSDAITNVGLAVGGAALLGSIIYGIVKPK